MKTFFPRWLKKSLSGTLVSGAVSTASLAVLATLIFCLVSVSSGIKSQLGKELKVYGANILVIPRAAPLRFGLGSFSLGTVDQESAIRVSDLDILSGDLSDLVESFAPGMIAGVSLNGNEAGAAGYGFDKLRSLNPLWHVSPAWPVGRDEAMIGLSLARRLGINAGDAVEIAAGNNKVSIKIVAEVETGTREDENIFIDLGLLQELSGRQDSVSLVLVRAATNRRPVNETAREIESAIPDVEARTLRQVAGAEEDLLNKVSRLLWLVTLAVGAATSFTVAGTIGVLLMSRRSEIGLCMALGATTGQLQRLFLFESAILGIVGGVAGCILGIGVAEAVAVSVFDTVIRPGLLPAMLATIIPVFISVVVSVWPVRNALRVSPCEVLREQ